MKEYSLKAALGAFAFALLISLAPASANATVLTHNGIDDEDFPGTGDIPVELFSLSGDDGVDVEIAERCIGFGADGCLGKEWQEGSLGLTHSIYLGLEPEWQGILVEFVLNTTGVAWTDYHIDFDGAILADFAFELMLVSAEGDFLGSLPGILITRRWIFSSIRRSASLTSLVRADPY